ncbi:MAG: SDR family NAD(P)-dependent oxidoreductase [Promethearchaeota archaeon]
MNRFKGKVALVCGNLGKIRENKFVIGLGGAIARNLLSEGAKVLVLDLNEKISTECAKALGNKIKAVHCDLFRERTYNEHPYVDERGKDKIEVEWLDFPALDMVKEIVKDYGKLDILVTNFDHFAMAKIEKSSEDLYNELRDKNLWPVFHLLAAVREQFKKQKEATGEIAKILIVSSIFGKAGLSVGSLYSAFNGSLVGLTKAMAREFSRFANVNAIAMGPISERKMQGPKDRVVSAYIATQTEMANNPMSLEDVAPSVSFLVSEEASCITGQILNVDQGLWLKLEC